MIDHQPDVNHDLPDPSPPNLPPLPESDSDEPISPTKRKANGFDRGDNEPSDKIEALKSLHIFVIYFGKEIIQK